MPAVDDAEGVAAIELNISCPNVSGGVDFGTDPRMCERLVSDSRRLPAADHRQADPQRHQHRRHRPSGRTGGADSISLINTCQGMAVDWRRCRPLLGNVLGGLSGPAIKPIALRAVYQVAQAVKTPLIGIGGIATLDDVMEFLVTGASAVQLGTVNFYDPTVSAMRILDALPAAIAQFKVASVADVVGTLQVGPIAKH